MPSLQDGSGGTPRGSGLPGLIGRIFAGFAALAMLVLGFMFSLAIFAVTLVVALVVFGWLWWKLRRTMRQMREDPRFRSYTAREGGDVPPARGEVIEGEVLHKEWRDGKDG
jgi:hypothetical protein